MEREVKTILLSPASTGLRSLDLFVDSRSCRLPTQAEILAALPKARQPEAFASPEHTVFQNVVNTILGNREEERARDGTYTARGIMTWKANQNGQSAKEYAERVGARTGMATRLAKSATSGVVGVGSGLLGAGSAFLNARGLEAASSSLDRIAIDLLPATPNFADKLASAVGSSATFFIPGVGIARGAAALKVPTGMARWLGSGAAAGMEAATESGSVYKQLRAQNMSEAEAQSRAEKVFFANLALTSVTNKLGLLNSHSNPVVRATLAGAFEGPLQEAPQQIISNVATGQAPLSDVLDAAIIGTLVGSTLSLPNQPHNKAQRENSQRPTADLDSVIPSQTIENVGLSAQELSQKWIAQLEAKNLRLNPEERSILESKLQGHIKKFSKNASLNIDTLLLAINSSPKFLTPQNKQGIHKLLSNYISKQELTLTNDIKARKGLSGPTNYLVNEYETANGQYALVSHLNRAHLREESQMLDHCIGNSTHYSDGIANGDIETFSLRDKASNQALVTIDYNKKTQTINQMRRKNNSKITGHEAYFPALLESLNFLHHSKDNFGRSRSIKHFSDTSEISLSPGTILTLDGKTTTFEKLNPSNSPRIFRGNINITPRTRSSDLRSISNLANIEADFSRANQKQKDSISTFEGDIRDDSNAASYANLTRINGAFRSQEADLINLPSLQYLGGDLKIVRATDLKMPALSQTNGQIEILSSGLKYIDLSTLRHSGDSIILHHAVEINLDSLQSVGGHLYANNATKLNLPKLRSIKDSLQASSTWSIDAPQLESIGDILAASSAKIISMPVLRRLGVAAYVGDPSVELRIPESLHSMFHSESSR